MLVFPAYAQSAATPAAGGGLMEMIIQFVLVMGILYLLLIRPQQKKMKKHLQALQAIKKGDKVLISGIVGTVVGISDAELTVNIAKDTDIKVMRYYVTEVLKDEKELVKKEK